MKKLFLRVMNIAFILAAGFGILKYATTPLLEIGVDAKVEATALNPLLANLPLGSITGEGGEAPEIDLSDYLDDIEIKDSDGNKVQVPGLALKISVFVDAKTLMGVFQAEDQKAFVKESLITPNIDALTAEIKEPLQNVVKGLLGSVASSMIQDTLLKSIPGLDASAFEGIDVAGEINSILDAFTAEGATIESLTAAVTASASSIISQLNANGQNIPTDALDSVPEMLNSTLTGLGLVDEDGNIASMDEAIGTLLTQFVGGGEDSGEQDPNPSEAKHYFAEGEVSGTTPEETPDLTTMLVDMIMGYIEPQLDLVVMGLQYGTYGLLALIAIWVLFILKCLIKIFAKNPGMKNHIFFFLQGLITFIFVVLHFALGNLGTALGLIGKTGFDISTYLPANIASFLPAIYNSAFIFNSSLVWSGIISIVITLVVSIIYGPIRRKVRKQLKEEKAKAKAK